MHILQGNPIINTTDTSVSLVVPENQTALILNNTKANQSITIDIKENSSLTFIAIQQGNSNNKQIITNLNGHNAKINIYGLFFGKNSEEISLDIKTNHNTSSTHSDMLVKGILDNNTKATFTGLINIPEGSKHCEGYQQEDTLLLSNDAKIYAVPDLAIANNNVKCSHGVTTTHINPEKQFYIQSRGVLEKEAEQLIIKAHITPIIDQIPNESLKQKILESIENTSQ